MENPYNPQPGPNEREAISLLALARLRGIGTATARKLYSHFGSLKRVWEAPPNELYEVLRKSKVRDVGTLIGEIKSKKRSLLDAAEREFEVFAQNDVHLIVDKDPRFPEQLKFITNPPHWLFVEGNPAILQRRDIVAIVGTRSPTEYGVNLAYEVAAKIAERGFVILSGLAEGIDASAHEGAVDVGGTSLAVLGTGILVTFPSTTMGLRGRIIDRGGAITTEYLPHASYSKQQFIERNRIQAGLASVVIPIQGKEMSGTAHTIRYAEEFGKLLIGITYGQPPRHAQNEVISLLRDHDHPVLDLLRDAKKFWELLSDLPTGREPRTVTREEERDRTFAPLIQEFRRAILRNSLSTDDVKWFLAQLEKIFAETRVNDGRKGSRIRHQ